MKKNKSPARYKCPRCGREGQMKIKDKVEDVDLEYYILECYKCGLIFAEDEADKL